MTLECLTVHTAALVFTACFLLPVDEFSTLIAVLLAVGVRDERCTAVYTVLPMTAENICGKIPVSRQNCISKIFAQQGIGNGLRTGAVKRQAETVRIISAGSFDKSIAADMLIRCEARKLC